MWKILTPKTMDVVNEFTKMLDAAKVELENAPSFYEAHPDTSFFKESIVK
ncbi:hypothetical protein [Legionella sp. PC997]|nr:hypothetical protein [Legionella sp. PC997]